MPTVKSEADIELLYYTLRERSNCEQPALTEKIDSVALTRLFRLAENEKILVDLYLALKKNNLIQLCSAKQKLNLKANRLNNEFRQDSIIEQICEISSLLAAAAIPNTLLKGGAIVAGGYQLCKGHRYYGDLDFVVQPEDLDITYEALRSHGYKPLMNLPTPLADYWESKHIPPLYKQGRLLAIECHQRPFESTRLHHPPTKTSDLLEHSTFTSLNGTSVSMPCPEHLILNSFYHTQIFDRGFIEGRNNYRAMIDASIIVEKSGDQLNWDLINANLTNTKTTDIFQIFVDNIATSIDKRAKYWSNIKTPPGYKNNYFKFARKNKSISKFVSTLLLYDQEIRRALSSSGRKQRKVLYSANRDNLKYAPVYRQLFSVSMLRHRLEYFLKMFRT